MLPTPARHRRPAGGVEAAALVAARTVSVLGDQLARVALSATVLSRTGSPLLAALVFAATFVPAVLGTLLLSGVGDRRPRRTVLVAGDLLRAGLVLLMTLPGLPLGGLVLLVVLVTLVDGPWAAARSALLRDAAPSDAQYQRVTALDETCTQTGQVLGYVAAGALVLLLGRSGSLLVNAGTFVVSALLLSTLVRHRPPPDAQEGRASLRRTLDDARVGWRAATGPASRAPVLLTWTLVTCAVAPEGLAVVWAQQLGAGPVGAGLLLAANPVGGVLGLLVLTRVGVARARRAVPALVGLSLLPLLLCAAGPSLPAVLLLVTLSGAGLTVTTVARVAFAASVPGQARARAFGVAGTGMVVGQGLGIAAAGALAEVTDAGTAVALLAALGLLAVLPALRLRADTPGLVPVAA